MRVLRRHSRHLPHTYALLRLPMGLLRGRHIFFLRILCVRLDRLCYFIFIVLLWWGEESGAEVSRGGVFKKYSSSINRPCAAAELILRSVHKAPCFSQHCTNSGIIMVLLVGRGRNDAEGRLAREVGVIYRCVKHDCCCKDRRETARWAVTTLLSHGSNELHRVSRVIIFFLHLPHKTNIEN